MSSPIATKGPFDNMTQMRTGQSIALDDVRAVLLADYRTVEACYDAIADLGPIHIGPSDPAMIDFATNTLYTRQIEERDHTTSMHWMAGPDADLVAAGLAYPDALARYRQQLYGQITLLSGGVPAATHLVSTQRTIDAVAEFGVGGLFHKDKDPEEIFQLTAFSLFENLLKEKACRQHGIDPADIGLTVADHSKIPLGRYYDILEESLMTADELKGPMLDELLDGAFHFMPNQRYFMCDMHFHRGGYPRRTRPGLLPYNAAAVRDIGFIVALNQEMAFRMPMPDGRRGPLYGQDTDALLLGDLGMS